MRCLRAACACRMAGQTWCEWSAVIEPLISEGIRNMAGAQACQLCLPPSPSTCRSAPCCACWMCAAECSTSTLWTSSMAVSVSSAEQLTACSRRFFGQCRRARKPGTCSLLLWEAHLQARTRIASCSTRPLLPSCRPQAGQRPLQGRPQQRPRIHLQGGLVAQRSCAVSCAQLK